MAIAHVIVSLNGNVQEIEPGDVLLTADCLIDPVSGHDVYCFHNERDPHDHYFSFIGDASTNWFKDRSGIDLLEFGFPFGDMIRDDLRYRFALLVKHFVAFEYWLNRFDTITIPPGCTEELQLAAGAFAERVVTRKQPLVEPSEVPELPIFTTIAPIQVPWQSLIMHLLQTAIRPFLRGKTLFLRDWTYELEPRPPGALLIYARNIFKGAYLRRLKTCKHSPPSLDWNKHTDQMVQIRQNHEANIDHIEPLMRLLKTIIERQVERHFQGCWQRYQAVEKCLEDYDPALVVVPSLSEPLSAAAIVAQRARGKACYFLQDGFRVAAWPFEFLSDDKPKKVDKVTIAGPRTRSIMRRNGFSDEDLIEMRPSVLADTPPPRDPATDPSFDAIVAFPHGERTNVTYQHHMCATYLAEVFTALQLAGKTRIAVKMKQPINAALKQFVDVAQITSGVNVTILGGRFAQHFSSTQIIVGYLGSTVGETSYHDVPYYVYQPWFMGMAKFGWENSIVDQSEIARTSAELEANLKAQRCVSLRHEVQEFEHCLRDLDRLAKSRGDI